MYLDILRKLGDAIRSKRKEKLRTSAWFLLHDNAPAHWSVLVKDFLTNNNVTILQQLPQSPDLSPADFYLLPRLKSTLKGRRFCDTTGFIKNATEELKRLSEIVSQECSRQLYSQVSQGNCFEGNVA